MPALHYSQLERRSQSNASLAITVGIVAATVLVICAVWGLVIPYIRTKSFPRLSCRNWISNSVSGRRRGHRGRFPGYPTSNPLLPRPAVLPTYDPRNESPFPNYPDPGLHSNGSAIWQRVTSAPTNPRNTSSDGLFTPERSSRTEQDLARGNFHTVPRGPDAKPFVCRSPDFGNTSDFILPVPEPAVLRSRPGGRPPAVTRHNQKYGKPYSNLPISTSDKHLHPNKLFGVVENESSWDRYCRDSSFNLMESRSDPKCDHKAMEMINLGQEDPKSEYLQQHRSRDHGESIRNFSSGFGLDDEDDRHNPSLTAIHRLRSYKSLTGSQIPTLTRAGTTSRPKTPIDQLKKVYGEEQRSVTLPTVCIPRYGTVSSFNTGFRPSLENDSISTPATSPTLPSGNPTLLPTPLRPRRNTGKFIEVGLSDDFGSGPVPPNNYPEEEETALPSLHTGLTRKRNPRVSRGFHHTGRRNKPAPANINTDLPRPSADDDWPLRTVPQGEQNVAPSAINRDWPRTQIRASSLYSRDTLGRSLIRTPTTADQISPIGTVFMNSNVTVSSNPFQSRESLDPDVTEEKNPFRSRESIRSKISEWNQRTEGQPLTPQLPTNHTISPAISIASLRDQFEPIKVGDHNKRRPERRE